VEVNADRSEENMYADMVSGISLRSRIYQRPRIQFVSHVEASHQHVCILFAYAGAEIKSNSYQTLDNEEFYRIVNRHFF
jgi:hypothetical protein